MILRLPIFLFVSVCILLCTACAKSREQCAEELYAQAINAFSDKRMGTARMLLDSMQSAYADIPTAHREAKDLLCLVTLYEQERNLKFLDSTMEAHELAIRPLMENMTIEDKNAPIPVLVHKSQRPAVCSQRCYVSASTDQNGNFAIFSHFTGERPIHHFRFRIDLADSFFLSDSVADEPFFHSFSDGDQVWESIKYTGQHAAMIASYIASNADANIKLDFVGPHAHYACTMSEADKQAIADVFSLSLLFRESVHIRGQIRNTKTIINKTKRRL